MIASEYLKLPETMQRMALLNGQVFAYETPFLIHQRLLGSLAFSLLSQEQKLGGHFYIAPLDVYLDELNVIQPDVMWLAPNRQCVADKYLSGLPEWVCEILATDTALHDLRNKFELYEKHNALECWFIDPEYELVTIWHRVGAHLQRLGVYGREEVVTSPLLGKIDLKAVFKDD